MFNNMNPEHSEELIVNSYDCDESVEISRADDQLSTENEEHGNKSIEALQFELNDLIHNQKEEAAMLMLKKHSSEFHTDIYKYALREAILADCLGFIRYLLKFLDINNIKYHGNYTPLTTACKYGSCASVKILLEAGADASRADKRGKFPLDVAIDAKVHPDEKACLFLKDKYRYVRSHSSSRWDNNRDKVKGGRFAWPLFIPSFNITKLNYKIFILRPYILSFQCSYPMCNFPKKLFIYYIVGLLVAF
eukprot:TRINITY_DN9888_c0_g2_i4.p2 TRINITY_DN9888_c0_g2~~TRINITY_DN9888_c0_g2_i4.p2  ORF type:complete len:249 (-),score=3.56 TRINITY_DN9888_c0_g2_i4:602-1348(-)